MLISFLITAYKEPQSIGKCLNTLISKQFLEYAQSQDLDYEILLACPDSETLEKARETGLEIIHIQDPARGKPTALNLLLKKAQGDYWIFTDGDCWFDENSTKNLIAAISKTQAEIFSARPISGDLKTNFFGYIGHLLADSAHFRRSENTFFPVSGYFYGLKKQPDLQIPEDCLSDDAYISYLIYQKTQQIPIYVPQSLVYIKYATSLKDFYKQKRRSAGGFSQLKEYGFAKVTRSFFEELKYFQLPLKYAKNWQELSWSLALFPIRFWLWVLIFWDRKILKKSFKDTWQRVESTK
jgi:glycosyltransferase involved in cell wall biosynthesis